MSFTEFFFEGDEGSVNGEEQVDKAAWERSGTTDHALGLLTLDRFKPLHGLLASDML